MSQVVLANGTQFIARGTIALGSRLPPGASAGDLCRRQGRPIAQRRAGSVCGEQEPGPSPAESRWTRGPDRAVRPDSGATASAWWPAVSLRLLAPGGERPEVVAAVDRPTSLDGVATHGRVEPDRPPLRSGAGADARALHRHRRERDRRAVAPIRRGARPVGRALQRSRFVARDDQGDRLAIAVLTAARAGPRADHIAAAGAGLCDDEFARAQTLKTVATRSVRMGALSSWFTKPSLSIDDDDIAILY